jgi:hypothetical protein
MTTDEFPPKDDASAGAKSPVRQKKPYSPPQLTTYGHISKLTTGFTGAYGDGGRRRRTPCL